jgi:tetratricopeptide (TPR) repeat protein
MSRKLHCGGVFLLGCGFAIARPDASVSTIDHARIIAGSSDLLKQQEPEMSPSEQAVYEKVAPILERRPAFALKLLTAMSTSSDPDQKPSPAFEFMAGNAFYSAGRYPEAEAKYRNAVERNPGFTRAWNNLGVLYYLQDRYADAVPCFSKSVSLGDRDPTTFGLLANSFEKSGNTVSAETAYMQALAADPANVSWMEGLLRIYMAGHQQAKAETLVRTLLKEHPGEARYWLAYVNLLLSAGRKMEATALLERMSATGLARDEDILLLGDLYAGQKMTPDALATFGRVLASQPELAEQKLLCYARVLNAEKAWMDALLVLDALSRTKLSPSGRIACLEIRADLEVGRNDWGTARRELEALLKEAPANGTAWLGLGRVCLAEAEPAKAVEAFEQAYRIPDSSYRASVELANIEYKNRHYKDCLAYLDHALGIQPSPALGNFRDQVRKLIPPEEPSHP